MANSRPITTEHAIALGLSDLQNKEDLVTLNRHDGGSYDPDNTIISVASVANCGYELRSTDHSTTYKAVGSLPSVG